MTEDQSAPSTQWTGLEYGPWQGVRLPRRPPTEEVREDLDLPRSVHPIDDEAVTQQPVFDPALAGYSRALRPSEPAFTDPALAERWLAARKAALDTVLSAVAASPWAEHLVLRGSVLLRAWYGEQAREPGDLDFVVRPVDWQLEDPRTDRMLQDLATAADHLSTGDAGDAGGTAATGGTGVRLHADQALSDEIWTYSRIPGRRLVLPWTAPGVPGGTVQLDFVFTEHLPVEPQTCELPGVTGPLLTATPQLSLAWKILWLVSDNHPQGKDLYDAVLLSRTTEVPYELLYAVFAQADEGSWWSRSPVLPHHIGELEVDWDEFAKDYPQFAEPVEEYPAQLLAGLGATFAGRTEYALRARWLAPLIGELRPVLAEEGLDAVLRHTSERHTGTADSLVIVCELLGGDLESARRAIADHHGGEADWRVRGLADAAERYAAQRATG
ncbi:nucleotidyl transferase AbiEii/AbiGii toxin family protein [Kitasatospora sp. NPDC004745]|uniref:nucleotidyl transferase AbiEii/AbiGii toxin family protein n=1 Tax=Kitasatospora sp. NPDC004745 TaxID=3364019 RepID=UPI003693FD15